MKKVLIVVDYQYDFVADDGLLTGGKPTQKIEENILKLMQEYKANNDDIIFTLDTHKKEQWSNHPESKSFSIHCEKHTKGHKPYGKTDTFYNYPNILFLEKQGYAPRMADIEKIINKYEQIDICGVVTDICVLQTSIVLYNAYVNNNKNNDSWQNIKFKIYKNACASFNKEGHNFAIDYMENILGFDIE